MKLTDEEFWNLTPFQYSVLVDEYNEEHKELRRSAAFRNANLMATIVNVNRDPKRSSEPDPMDYLPSEFRPKPKARTWQEEYALMKSLYGKRKQVN